MLRVLVKDYGLDPNGIKDQVSICNCWIEVTMAAKIGIGLGHVSCHCDSVYNICVIYGHWWSCELWSLVVV